MTGGDDVDLGSSEGSRCLSKTRKTGGSAESLISTFSTSDGRENVLLCPYCSRMQCWEDNDAKAIRFLTR
ncbi:hypothetical protein WG66_006519 [Moniliophthora roreri]|nr:hypothetical protein WG66_006519 [Moniliophthora roreri]